jgi:hypothetical protein
MAVVRTGRPDPANLTDIAAVDVTVRIDKVVDLEARFGRYGGQECLGLACGDQRIAGARSPRDRDTDHGRELEGATVRSVAPRSDAVDGDQLGK